MKKHLIRIMAIAALACATTSTQAAEPLALQKIMKDLGAHMQTVTDGISREDWALVGKTAPLIAEHPQPPLTEKMRIMGFMGSDMGKFKAFDEQTHEVAHEMMQAAQAKDGQKVIASFQRVQTSCLGCHQAFRTLFVEHFYGKPRT